MGHGRNLRRGFVEEADIQDLKAEQRIGKVTDLRDKGILSLALYEPEGESLLQGTLAYLPPRFRGVLFIRRGAFILVSPMESGASDKVTWTVDALLRPSDIKALKKASKWPSVFETVAAQDSDSDSESEQDGSDHDDCSDSSDVEQD